MKLFGLNITKSQAVPERRLSTQTQFRDSSAQGWMTNWFNNYYIRKVSGDFYEILREGIPIIDSAIRRLISLNGTIKIIGDNAAIVKELEDFCLNVPVNDMQTGIHSFLENASNETFEQGFSVAEFIVTKDMKDIAGLRVADSKQIVFRKNAAGGIDIWYRYPGNLPQRAYGRPEDIVQQILTATYNQAVWINGLWEEKLVPDNKLYFSINNENTDPSGVSIMRSMEFVSKILMTMQNSLANVWERFGDPSFHVLYKTTKRDMGGDDIEKRRLKLQTDFNTAIRAKREGKSADFVTAVNADADVQIKVIGHDNQVLQIDIPSRHVLEQIVSKTNLPAWMLGLYWSTTERMATLEVESALQDAKIRQLAMLPTFIKLFSTVLMLRGHKWKTITTDIEKPGDWGIIFETPNLRDLVSQAQAKFLNAQADMMGRGGQGVPPAQTNMQMGGASVDIQGMKFPVNLQLTTPPLTPQEGNKCGGDHDHKELNRPIPWQALDNVEAVYEARMKKDWLELQGKVFDILKLPETKSVKAFDFSDDQRASIMAYFKQYLGMYNPQESDYPVRWAYGYAYSLGLIQAANLVGKKRPILNIIKSKEILDNLAQDGFKLVKDSATTVIVDKIIPSIETLVGEGVNPLDVAGKLKKTFGDQNASWERLARSEMSMAAERAKLDEWFEWGVDIDNAVIAVEDTHPRCRCANTIKEIGGKLVIAFTPAPDACPICQALAQ